MFVQITLCCRWSAQFSNCPTPVFKNDIFSQCTILPLRQCVSPNIDRSPELAPSHSIPVTLKQIIDLKNYYVKSPEGRAKPESVDARSKFDIYKFQISQHGKAVTGDPNLKLTNQFFKTFESQQVTLSIADRLSFTCGDKLCLFE
jgi:hypothetical protein